MAVRLPLMGDPMCSPAVIDYVSQALGPADRGGSVSPSRAQSRGGPPKTCFSEVHDLTHPLREDFPSANGERWLEVSDVLTFAAHGINFKRWSIHEHLGTHIDAPIHFSQAGATVDEIPARSLVLPLAVLDIRARAAETADAELTPEDVAAWEAEHGEIPAGSCVAMNSGWDVRAAGSGYRGADDAGIMHFPGLHPETAQMLLEDRDVLGLGVDTLSVDVGSSTEFPVHRLWLPSGRWVVEGLANLSALPPTGATIVVGAPTVVGGSGGPSRVIALV